jgi:hypothetical protein
MHRFVSTLAKALLFVSLLSSTSCSVEAPEIRPRPTVQQLRADEMMLLNQSLDQVGASIAAHAMLQKFAVQQTDLKSRATDSRLDAHSLRQLTSNFEPNFKLLETDQEGIRIASATVDVSAAMVGLTDGDQRLTIEVEGQFKQVEGVTEILKFKGSFQWTGARPENQLKLEFASSVESSENSVSIEFSVCDLNRLLHLSSSEEILNAEQCGNGKLSGRFSDGVLSLKANAVELPIGPYSMQVSKLECEWNIGSDDGLAIEIAAEIFRDGRNVGFIRGSHLGNGNSSIEAKLSDELN